MHKRFLLVLALISFLGAQAQNDGFTLGADLGWSTEMEAGGRTFTDANGNVSEVTAAMKSFGMNAVRCRVWVDPSAHGGYCTPSDVLTKALRAKALGMDVMIDFHYSDWWADPGKQNIPARWAGLSYETMRDSLVRHTTEVLTYLKAGGITPRWVQVGNETSNGLLWPVGNATTNPAQYAGFITAGHDAVKAVFPDAQVIVHLDNGFDRSLYDWNLGVLRDYGARYDLVGMSLYPTAAVEWHAAKLADKNADGTIDPSDAITQTMENIRHVKKAFGRDVLITEIGVPSTDAANGKRYVHQILQDARLRTDGICRGVFYWEPEAGAAWQNYALGAYHDDGTPTAIMEAFRENAPTSIRALRLTPAHSDSTYTLDGRKAPKDMKRGLRIARRKKTF